MQAHAARLIEHEQPLSVETVELPEPSDGEVLIQMVYGSVNPVDRYAALGRVAPNGPRPRTMGAEGSGLVGGRRVMVRGHRLGTGRDGVWATAAVVPESALIDVPDGVDLRQAAAVGIAGVTAWRCVTEKAQVTSADRVLVLGASGGVGSIVVSAAKAIGAEVWGHTASSDKAEWIRERGADNVVVADVDTITDAARDFRPTVVFDPLGDGFFAAAVEVLAERGRLVIFGTSADPRGDVPLQVLYRKGLTVYGYAGLIEDDLTLDRAARDALQAVGDSRMQIVIDRVLPLAEVNEGFQLLVDRSVQGKILLDLEGSPTAGGSGKET